LTQFQQMASAGKLAGQSTSGPCNKCTEQFARSIENDVVCAIGQAGYAIAPNAMKRAGKD
jgi:hypothetical protein